MNQRDSLQWELEHRLAEKGCAICHISQKAVEHFLDAILYESVNDPDVRQHVLASLGFCNRHAWQMRKLGGNALGMAILHRSAVNQWQKQLAEVPKPDRRTKFQKYRDQVARANHAKKSCLGCEKQVEIEARYIEAVLKSITDPEFSRLLDASAGFCRRHFAQACKTALDSETLNALVKMETEINRRLIGELDEFIRKSDYRFISEGFAAEGDSRIRAIEHLSGVEDAVC